SQFPAVERRGPRGRQPHLGSPLRPSQPRARRASVRVEPSRAAALLAAQLAPRELFAVSRAPPLGPFLVRGSVRFLVRPFVRPFVRRIARPSPARCRVPCPAR